PTVRPTARSVPHVAAIRCSIARTKELDNEACDVDRGAGNCRRGDRASGAGAAEPVGYVAAAELHGRAGEPVRVYDHADGRQRDDPYAAQQSRVGDAETERRDTRPDRWRPGGHAC